MTAPNWDALRAAARAAAGNAYAPYSRLYVGAAGLAADGRVVVGCNVENASYGLTLCAECGLLSSLVAGGRTALLAVTVVSATGDVLPPCGRCRQMLMEHAGPECLVDTVHGPRPLGELLPGTFGSGHLPS